MTELQRHQVKFGVKSFVQFMGKGRKERAVPLWPTTTRALQAWFKEVESDKRNGAAAFPNARGQALSRDGVNYLLQECVGRAVAKCPSLANKRISPHVFRHSAAMHLLQAGVDITVIALWLGHESIQTTHGYIEADLATKPKSRCSTNSRPQGSLRSGSRPTTTCCDSWQRSDNANNSSMKQIGRAHV